MARAEKVRQMKKQIWISVLSVMSVYLFFAVGSSVAVAGEVVGKVVAVRGNVLAVDADGAGRQLVLRESVFEGDTVKTGANGRLQMLFSDQTIVSLGRNTEMELARYAWSPDQQTGEMTTRVKEGAFRIMGGAITRSSPENFVTETPAATIGVRGSLYSGLVSADILSVLFQGGKGIDIITEHGAVAITTPGFGTRVSMGKPPRKPNRYLHKDLQQIDGEFLVESDTAATEEPRQPDSTSPADAGEPEAARKTGAGDSQPAEAPEPLIRSESDSQSTATREPLQSPQPLAVIQIDQDFETVSTTLQDRNQTTLTNQTTVIADPDLPITEPDPPVAADDTVATLEDTAVEINLPTNDTDPDGTIDPATVTIVDQPANGTVSVNPVTGIVTYTPDDNYFGSDSFTYTIQDNDGIISNIATVTVGIEDVIDTPPTPPTPTPVTVAFSSGRYLNTLVDDGSWYGPVTATSVDGLVGGQSTTQDSTLFGISYQLPVYDPTVSYAGSSSSSGLSRTLSLRDLNQTFSSMVVHWAEPGEFGYFTTADSLVDGNVTYDFWEMGFAGIHATTVPGDGVDIYQGEFLAAPFDLGASTLFPGEVGPVKLLVNWHNNRVFASIEDRDPMDPTRKGVMFFFGDISGTSLVNVQGFSSGGDPSGNIIEWHEGIVDFGQFYGSNYQGFGVSGNGLSYNIADQAAPIDSWRMVAAGFRDPVPLLSAAPTGTENWQGMAVGISEDMTNPGLNRRLFMSHPFGAAPTAFQFSVDRDAGKVNGSLALQDLLDPDNVLKNITIGSTYGSVAIIDDVLLAGLGCTSLNCIETGTAPDIGSLKAHGNYLIANPDSLESIASHVGWGYWEIAYDDPGTGKPYHLHVPYSMWVAGERTIPAEVQARIDTAFTGTYRGRAFGSLVRTDGMVTNMTGGNTELTVDFNPSASLPVYGSISFNEAGLTVSGTVPVSDAGFHAGISDVTIAGEPASPVAGSEVNAFFYGANGFSIGGNFSAKRTSGEELLGIIGGDLQP